MRSTQLDNRMRSLYRDAISLDELTRHPKWNWDELEDVVKRIAATALRTPLRPKSAKEEMQSVIQDLSSAFESAHKSHGARQKQLIKEKILRLTELIEGMTTGESKQNEIRSVLKGITSVFTDVTLMIASDRQELSPQLDILADARRRFNIAEQVGARKGSAESQPINDVSRHEPALASGSMTKRELALEEECLLLVGGSAIIHYLWLECDYFKATTSLKGMNVAKALLEAQDKLRQEWDRWMIGHTAEYLSSKYALDFSKIIGKERLNLDFNRFYWALVYYETQLVELTDRQKLDQGDELVAASIRIAKRRIAQLRKSIQEASQALKVS